MPKPGCPEDNSFNYYLSAVVLGMNDALVELTGALAGFTMALGSNRLIALAGLTTGIAATLSMAASEFLSQEAGESADHSWLAAFYTGIAYLLTTAILLAPFFLMPEPFGALAICLCLAALIIFVFTYVISRMCCVNFKHNFLRMLIISFGVSAIAFGLSWLAKLWWGIEV